MVCLKAVDHNTLPMGSYKFESGVSSSGDGGEAVPELNPSPNGKRKRSRNEGGAAEMTNSNKRKRGEGSRNNGQAPPPELPADIKKLLQYLPESRSVSAAKLVVQKQLTDTDVSHHHNRLSIPTKHLHEAFLTEEEEVLLCSRKDKNVGSMDVPVITPMMDVTSVSLRRWEMKKARGPSSITYVLTSTWNTIREQNKLRSGVMVQLWAIRIDGFLCFALTILP